MPRPTTRAAPATALEVTPERILVTGGAGFIGSHLIDRLLADGHQVLCIDDLSTGDATNIAHLENHPRFEFRHHDVMDPFEAEVARIYNLACPASPLQYRRDPVRTTRTAVLGALNMLGLARRTGATILQASTSEVYGDPAVHPQPESYVGHVNPLGPRACYDEGKRCAETLFMDHHRQYGVPIRIARIFNTYGPRLQRGDGRVVANFIVRALAGAPLALSGDGAQTRAFCYVDDLVEGLIGLMATGSEITGPVNLGNPQEIAVRDLAHIVIRLTGSPSAIEHHPRPQDDPSRRCPDITLAKELLDWTPTIDLETGLRKTIEYFKILRHPGLESGSRFFPLPGKRDPGPRPE